jgi:hypothetical protein
MSSSMGSPAVAIEHQYTQCYRETGPYAYDRDPGRPGRFPILPNERWADPRTPPPTPIAAS